MCSWTVIVSRWNIANNYSKLQYLGVWFTHVWLTFYFWKEYENLWRSRGNCRLLILYPQYHDTFVSYSPWRYKTLTQSTRVCPKKIFILPKNSVSTKISVCYSIYFHVKYYLCDYYFLHNLFHMTNKSVRNYEQVARRRRLFIMRMIRSLDKIHLLVL